MAGERSTTEAKLKEIEAQRDLGIDYIADFKAKRDILRAVREAGLKRLQAAVSRAP